MSSGPVVPTAQALSALRPLPLDAVRLDAAGLLGGWQARHPAMPESPGETALAEMFRITGLRPYLDKALDLVNPLREATSVTGHVGHQLGLLSEAVDAAVETHDRELLDAAIRLFDDALTTRTHLTGGHAARDEAYADPYDLPPTGADALVSTAIASFRLAWRLLLATGDVRWADEMERVLHNAIAAAGGAPSAPPSSPRPSPPSPPLSSSLSPPLSPPLSSSLSSPLFFSASPLQARAPLTRTATCPPDLAAFMSSLHAYVATSSPSGMQLHLYAGSTVSSASRTIEISTRYPWDEQVTITVVSTSDQPWTLALRTPAWCTDLRLTVNGTPVPARRLVEKGYLRLHRSWHPGDTLTLTLAMPARRITAHPRVDATRGAAALVRGPLVYCLEQADLPTTGRLAGAHVDDLELDPSAPLAVAYHTAGISPVTLQAPVHLRPQSSSLYRTLPATPAAPVAAGVATAIPYYLWANRTPGPMRVWIPLAHPLDH
ncbi:hypothetical protein ACTI_44020 [Actinoplanes sp. OR16]|uniref:beta-L-arabinofuranosidase domain-containing protein n=1 Tax=Actinoplanes sp. OR16 TaxID=946334 RepID=UPI000F6ECF42|nr:beta-L-arabinofuranosidase domain-containing protein [Actinoplanes sp. OR16]BBH67717.1 hypothetical protein ACTI_44020 [Actinoplanes sp. OR16]